MNEEQYRHMCDACDAVLFAQDTTIERTAIPWLHVIREHPEFLKNYEDLFATQSKPGFARNLRFHAGWVWQLLLSLWSGGQSWFGRQIFRQPVDIIFISHFLNASQAGIEADFYFGDLPARLHTEGHRVVVALVDQTGQASESLVSNWDSSGIPRLVFSNSLAFGKEWSLYKRLKGEAKQLSKKSNSLVPGMLRRVFAQAAVEALSGSARATLRMHLQIKDLVARARPQVVITTYEGHAWERMAFAAAREAMASITCVGYQHAAIFRLQHSACRNLQPRFNPDQLLAAGPVSKKQLRNSPGLSRTPVEILGSPRTANRSKSALPQKLNMCLVLPEGFLSECHILFEFSISCAKLCPNIRFVWRLHPIVKYETLIAGNPAFKDLPKNVEVSTVSIEEDFESASHALYRGSTAIVSAACTNVQPIYLELPGEMTLDPLFELASWRERVHTAEEFSAVVSRQSLSPDMSKPQIEAMTYCRNFYTPMDATLLPALLHERGI